VSLSFPASLSGTSITLLDSQNQSYAVPIYSVSPGQVNYLVPSAANPGPATVTVTSSGGVTTTGIVLVQPVAPGLYTANANGQGAAAAIAITTHADGSQSSADPAQMPLAVRGELVYRRPSAWAVPVYATCLRCNVSASINKQTLRFCTPERSRPFWAWIRST
jgi:uncharacterized protein (TIGR03437 family)